MKLRNNHKFLTVSNYVAQICEPLRHFHIHHFSYFRRYQDNSEVYLSNKAQWIKDYYELGLYQTSLYAGTVNNLHTGFSLWPHENSTPIFQHGRDYYDNHYGFTYYNQHAEYHEFFFFGLPRKDIDMWNFCLTHLDLIEKFTRYFSEKADYIIRQCHNSRILLPNLQPVLISPLNDQYQKAKDSFLKKINDGSLMMLAQPTEALTEREKECLLLLLTEQTAKKIAARLNISIRTVETHLNNIRQKYQCANKTELIIKVTSKA